MAVTRLEYLSFMVRAGIGIIIKEKQQQMIIVDAVGNWELYC